MGCASYLISLYGVVEFFEDVDRDRQFWREIPCCCEKRARACECDRGRETVTGSVLSWVAGPGFSELSRDVLGFQYATAHEFRQRMLLALTRG
jgi:hypothetical protein